MNETQELIKKYLGRLFILRIMVIEIYIEPFVVFVARFSAGI